MLANNRYYFNVRINVDALALLPDDRNLNGLHSITLDSTIDDPEPLSAQNENPYDAHLSASFVPSTTQWMTEQETIMQAVCARTTASSATSGSPYGIMAGAADFVAPRPLAVSVGNNLLMYADGRFARHPRFRYFALNTEMRWRSLQVGRIYVRQHPHDAQLFSSIVLTWLLFISTIIVLQSQALRRNVYIGMLAQARPPPPNALHSSSYKQVLLNDYGQCITAKVQRLIDKCRS